MVAALVAHSGDVVGQDGDVVRVALAIGEPLGSLEVLQGLLTSFCQPVHLAEVSEQVAFQGCDTETAGAAQCIVGQGERFVLSTALEHDDAAVLVGDRLAA